MQSFVPCPLGLGAHPHSIFSTSSRRAVCSRRKVVRCTTEGATGVLLVCLGNICRSPAAEAVLKARADVRGLSDIVHVDSCGTGGGRPEWFIDGMAYHKGDDPDHRMRAAASQRGLQLTSISRPLVKEDFDEFHRIIAMDENNIEAIEEARKYWEVPSTNARVELLTNFSSKPHKRGTAIPDPYYGGPRGFDIALDLIQDACDGLLDDIVEERKT